jgi:hypothetical protein
VPNDPPRNLAEELEGREACRRQAPSPLSRTPQTPSQSVAWFAHSVENPRDDRDERSSTICAGSATNPAKRESRTRIGGTEKLFFPSLDLAKNWRAPARYLEAGAHQFLAKSNEGKKSYGQNRALGF